MALIPDLTVNVKDGKLLFIDTTGLYDADVNAGGFNKTGGDPNVLRSAITKIVITVETPSGNTHTFDTSASTLTLAKLASAGTSYWDVWLLLTDDIELIDGNYEINYSLYVSATEYTFSDNFYYLSDIKCCIAKKLVELVKDPNCLSNGKLLEVMKYWGLLKGIQFNAAGGTTVNADYILEKLQNWCDDVC